MFQTFIESMGVTANTISAIFDGLREKTRSESGHKHGEALELPKDDAVSHGHKKEKSWSRRRSLSPTSSFQKLEKTHQLCLDYQLARGFKFQQILSKKDMKGASFDLSIFAFWKTNLTPYADTINLFNGLISSNKDHASVFELYWTRAYCHLLASKTHESPKTVLGLALFDYVQALPKNLESEDVRVDSLAMSIKRLVSKFSKDELNALVQQSGASSDTVEQAIKYCLSERPLAKRRRMKSNRHSSHTLSKMSLDNLHALASRKSLKSSAGSVKATGRAKSLGNLDESASIEHEKELVPPMPVLAQNTKDAKALPSLPSGGSEPVTSQPALTNGKSTTNTTKSVSPAGAAQGRQWSYEPSDRLILNCLPITSSAHIDSNDSLDDAAMAEALDSSLQQMIAKPVNLSVKLAELMVSMMKVVAEPPTLRNGAANQDAPSSLKSPKYESTSIRDLRSLNMLKIGGGASNAKRGSIAGLKDAFTGQPDCDPENFVLNDPSVLRNIKKMPTYEVFKNMLLGLRYVKLEHSQDNVGLQTEEEKICFWLNVRNVLW
jgi:hypothetical protein